MGEISWLPDDMLRDILLRFRGDAVALFRCATVCKRWRRLVADPSFLRRCWPHHDGRSRSSLAGFFALSRALFGRRGRRGLKSFIPAAAAGLFNHAVPLAWRHGHLLVRLSPHGGGDTAVIRLAVCDLLTGACHVFPPLNPAREFVVHNKDGYAILTGADCGQRRSPFFKVVVFNVAYMAPRMMARQDDESTDVQAAPERCLCTKTVELRHPEGGKKAGVVKKCGKLLVTDNQDNVYAADLGTGTMEEVTAWPGRRRFNRDDADEVVPLEMDWPATFVSRLGDRAP
ncbi:LOW QUALITY PROTEIN: hypothetical protein BRADI_2g62098v3 [Brachypodium distachyon]|uniref:F-box domain-containing protein n=1 Tax=Brachypodium distachyon TaxID=15368 RepID=A0A2K2DHD9_BRADI|nr:LOW QUALITY PROTEIN: hypothetical protein BRADI_2g62098v3 [Brachypodium distachyon]